MADEPNWLEAEKQCAWRHYLRGARALEDALDASLLKHGMSLAEYEVLSMLSEAPEGRLRMGALAERVVQSRSRITHTATRLAKRGWVQREQCANDARGIELVLTPIGLAELQKAAEVHVADVRRFMVDVMPDEQFLQLGDGMRRVHEAVDSQSH